jgi:hypothetical protein
VVEIVAERRPEFGRTGPGRPPWPIPMSDARAPSKGAATLTQWPGPRRWGTRGAPRANRVPLTHRDNPWVSAPILSRGPVRARGLRRSDL